MSARRSKVSARSKSVRRQAIDPIVPDWRSAAMMRRAIEQLASFHNRPGNLAGIFSERQIQDISSVVWTVAHESGQAASAEIALKNLLAAVRQTPSIRTDAARQTLVIMIQRVHRDFFDAYIDAAIMTGLALGVTMWPTHAGAAPAGGGQ